jgi:carbohydrate/starch-binding protein with CBM21 domain
MKKFNMFIVSIVFIISLSTMVMAAGEVQLVSASSTTHSKYGMYQQDTSYKILVKNIAYTKNVSIWIQDTAGVWSAIPAEFYCSAPDNMEVWKAGSIYRYPRILKFAVRYQVNGQTYWDNNNGSNYEVGPYSGTLLNNVPLLVWFPGHLYSERDGTVKNSSINLVVNVQNLTYHKQVTVVYTTDGWATTQTKSLSFESAYTFGYTTIFSPNAYGVEIWKADVFVGENVNRIEYAVSYTADGQTYWDNNFGNNYVVERVFR